MRAKNYNACLGARSSLDYLMICGCYDNYTGTVQQLRKFEATGDVCAKKQNRYLAISLKESSLDSLIQTILAPQREVKYLVQVCVIN